MNILFTLLQLFIIQPITIYTGKFLSKYVEIWSSISTIEYTNPEILSREIEDNSNESNYINYLKYTNDFLRAFPKHLPYAILMKHNYKNVAKNAENL